MVGGTADCRVEFIESGVALEPASGADSVVVHSVWILAEQGR